MDTFKRPAAAAAAAPVPSSSRQRKAAVDRRCCGDIFPSDVIDSYDKLDTTSSDKVNIDAVVPFTSFVIKTRHCSQMCYKILELNSNLKDHFSYVCRRLGKPGSECRRISRKKLEKRLSKPFEASNKKNADVRLGYRCENTFFVKYLFTFGVRRTEKDEIHLLQTYEAPLWYFQSRMRNDAFFRPKSLDFMSEAKFSQHKLLPKRMYAIKENVRYAILAVQKTKFSIHRCNSRLAEEIESYCYDPRMDDCDYYYSVPPPTPSLDMDAKWDDDYEESNEMRQQLEVAGIEENIVYSTMDLEAIEVDESLYDSEQLDALFAELVPKNI